MPKEDFMSKYHELEVLYMYLGINHHGLEFAKESREYRLMEDYKE
jgi:hypothetical protein